MIGYAFRRAFKGMREYRLLAGATVATVATVLLLAGTFVLLLNSLSGLLDRWGKDVQVSCYLRDDVSDDRLFELKAELEALPEVATVVYVSKDDALERFADAVEGLDRILADLDENPLPASLEIRLDAGFQEPAQVATVAERLRRPEFEDLDYSREWVERYYTFLGMLRLSSVVLGALLLAAGVFLVSNTIRIAIYARREELALVALVGGTRWFARLPLLVEGGLQGTAGGLLALLLLAGLHRYAFVQLQASLGMLLPADALGFLSPAASLALVLAGSAVGLLGAWTSALRTDAEGLR